MSLFNRVKNTISQKLPSVTRPTTPVNSSFGKYLLNYGWIFQSSNKSLGEYNSYMNAYEYNVYVYRCVEIISDTLLINGFKINNPHEEYNNPEKVNYLTNLFNNPSGYLSEITYTMFHKQYVNSFELTGDAFIEVNYEDFNHHDIEYNIISGFRFIPPELLKYFPDTDQWGYRNKPSIRYEKDELIHIYKPNIRFKDSKYGVGPLDKIRVPLQIINSGLKHNLDLLENDGLDPKAVLSFDKEIDDDVFEAELERLAALSPERKNGGTLAIKGASFQSASASNDDMDFMNLMNFNRDMILTAFGVQPGKAGIRETASLGTGTGESQDKDFKDMMNAKGKFIEDAFNKVLGHNGFDEFFSFNEMDIEDKLKRAQIESTKINSNVLTVNEVRKGYGLEPVAWGDEPNNIAMNSTDNVDLGTDLKNHFIKTGLINQEYY